VVSDSDLVNIVFLVSVLIVGLSGYFIVRMMIRMKQREIGQQSAEQKPDRSSNIR
jgi:hypothetical protein